MLQALLGASLFLWSCLGAWLLWNSRGAGLLRAHSALEPMSVPARWPKVSILVPARNEEESLPALLHSLLRLDYPDYEVIVVDDHSTDGTGRVAEEWSRRPEAQGRLRVIHHREPAPGWTGKVYALHLAAGAATGEWILSTDADVVFHPRVLRLAMSAALGRGVSLVSLTPDFVYGSFWEKAVLPAFAMLLFALFPLRWVNHPRSSRAIAAGAFILMRRDDFRALGGYEPLAHVVNEDLRIAEHFKRQGRRIWLIPSRGLIRTRMYNGAGEMFEGLSRSAFEGAGYSVVKILAGILVGLLMAVLPWVAAALVGIRDGLRGQPLLQDQALLLALTACAVSAWVYLPAPIFLGVSPGFVFTLPLAAVFYSAASLNSTWTSLAGRGVSWKGRYYRPAC